QGHFPQDVGGGPQLGGQRGVGGGPAGGVEAAELGPVGGPGQGGEGGSHQGGGSYKVGYLRHRFPSQAFLLGCQVRELRTFSIPYLANAECPHSPFLSTLPFFPLSLSSPASRQRHQRHDEREVRREIIYGLLVGRDQLTPLALRQGHVEAIVIPAPGSGG